MNLLIWIHLIPSTTIARQEIYEKVYIKRHSNSPSIKIREFLLLQSNKLHDRKGGKFF